MVVVEDGGTETAPEDTLEETALVDEPTPKRRRPLPIPPAKRGWVLPAVVFVAFGLGYALPGWLGASGDAVAGRPTAARPAKQAAAAGEPAQIIRTQTPGPATSVNPFANAPSGADQPTATSAPPTAAASQSTVAPTASAEPTRSGPTATARPVPTQTNPPRVYVVQSGDTIYDIARRFNIDPRKIIDANHLAKPEALDLGQKLIIP